MAITVTAFNGHRRMVSGPIHEVVLGVRNVMDADLNAVRIYEDATGRMIDVDTRGSDQEVLARLAWAADPAPLPRGPGRPKLGVVAREITLLPRHWDWLNTQPGGASVAIRKLVEEARRTSGDKDRSRAAQEAAYRFMSSIAGDMAGFEEAARALFANDRRRFGELVAGWPEDVRDHAIQLAFADLDPEKS